MTYRLTEWAKTRVAVYGVPWRDLSDEEFRAADELHGGVLVERGYFEPVEDESPDQAAPAPRRRSKR